MLNDDNEEDNVPHVEIHNAAALNARINNEYKAHINHKVTDGKMRHCDDGDANDEFHVLLWWKRKDKELTRYWCKLCDPPCAFRHLAPCPKTTSRMLATP